MQLLPCQPADQLVTRVDMHAQTALLRGEIAERRADGRIEIRTEIAALKVWVQRWVSGAAAVNLVALFTALAT
jgi:hypothetical protein